jgi:hypothetical protein
MGAIARRTGPSYRDWAVEAVEDLETATANRNDAIRAWADHGGTPGAISDACGLSRSTVDYIVQQGRKAPVPAVENRDSPEYGWDRFWDRYPRRNGKRLHKADTLAIWRRLKYKDKAAAYEGTGHYAKACQDGLTIAMDAHRWLGKREWEEWQTPAVPDAHVEPRLTGTDRAKPAAERYLARNGTD